MNRRVSSGTLETALVVGWHLALALVAHAALGVDIRSESWRTWDSFWQSLPLELLRAEPMRALLHLHSQPPIWNALGALAAAVSGTRTLEFLYGLNVALGSALCGLVHALLRRLVRRPGVALALALTIASSPALLLYEAYAFYAVLTAFLLVLATFFADSASRTRRPVYGVLFVASVNVLVLTRSLYHPVLVVLAAIWAARTLALRRANGWGLVAVCTPTIAWLLKNLLLFGFFGTSSWLGMNAWRMVSSSYPTSELASLSRAGIVDPMVVEVPAFSPPSRYARYGFDARPAEPSLAGEQFNNLNFVAASRVYGRNAWHLVRRAPSRYVGRALRSALLYTYPASRYEHLQVNRAKLAALEGPVGGRLFGADWARWRGRAVRAGPVFLLLAALSAGRLGWTIARSRRGAGGVLPLVERQFGSLWPLFFVAYNFVVSSLLEFGENERFRFDVDAILLLIFAAIWWGRTGAQAASSTD